MYVCVYIYVLLVHAMVWAKAILLPVGLSQTLDLTPKEKNKPRMSLYLGIYIYNPL